MAGTGPDPRVVGRPRTGDSTAMPATAAALSMRPLWIRLPGSFSGCTLSVV